jgi:hypothetical protein
MGENEIKIVHHKTQHKSVIKEDLNGEDMMSDVPIEQMNEELSSSSL